MLTFDCTLSTTTGSHESSFLMQYYGLKHVHIFFFFKIRLSDMQAVLREAKSAYLDILLDEEAEDSQHVSTEPHSGSEYK